MICSIERDEKRQVVDVKGADGKSAPIFQELSKYFGSNKDIALMWTLRTNTKAFKDWYGNKELELIKYGSNVFFESESKDVLFVLDSTKKKTELSVYPFEFNEMKEKKVIIESTIEAYENMSEREGILAFESGIDVGMRLDFLREVKNGLIAGMSLMKEGLLFDENNKKDSTRTTAKGSIEQKLGRVSDFDPSVKFTVERKNRLLALAKDQDEKDKINLMSSHELYVYEAFSGKEDSAVALIDGKQVTKEEAIKKQKELREKSIDKGLAADKAIAVLFDRELKDREKIKDDVIKSDYNWMLGLEERLADRWQLSFNTIVKTQSEFYSEAWDTVFKPDVLVYYEDGKVGIREIKTETMFSDLKNYSILKYGNTNYLQIINTKENLAKLQVVLMAVMMKSNNPNLKFKNLGIDLIRNNVASSGNDSISNYSISAEEIASFLEMIEKYLSEPQNKGIMDKIKDSNVFDYKDYAYESISIEAINKNKRITAVVESEDDFDMQLKKLTRIVSENEVRSFRRQLERLTIDQNNEQDEDRRKNIQAQIAIFNKKLETLYGNTEDIFNAYTVNRGEKLNSVKRDLGFMSMYASSLADSRNTIVATFNKLYQDRLHELTKKKNKLTKDFLSLYIPVLNEARQRKGLAKIDEDPVKLMDGSLANNVKMLIGNISHNEIFNRLSVSISMNGISKNYLRRPAKESQIGYWDKHRANISGEIATLTEAEIKLLNWINNYNDSIFIDKNGQTALANRARTVKNSFNEEKDNNFISELGFHNNEMGMFGKEKANFSYSNATMNGDFGFFPKTNLMQEELNDYKFFEFNPSGLKDNLKKWFVRNAFSFLEKEVKTDYDESLPGLHLRFLGDDETDIYTHRYSKSIENSMMSFIDNNLRLEYLQDVYSFGRALIEYNKYKDIGTDGTPNNGELGKMLERLMYSNLKGYDAYKFIENGKDASALGKRIFTVNIPSSNGHSVAYRISAINFLKYLKGKTSSAIMAFSPISALVNWVQTLQASLRVAMTSSSLRKMLSTNGVNPDDIDFTVSNYIKGYRTYIGSQAGLMKGERDKMFLLAKELRYLPDNTDWAMDHKSYITKHLAGKNGSYAFVLHSVPEEANAMAIMYAILKSRKHNGKSLYDLYEVKDDIEESNGVEVKTKKLVWTGGIRGKEEILPGITKDVEGITYKEAMAYRAIYRNIQGGYRHDERTYFELTVFGDLFLQFRKFMPAMLKRSLQSQGNDYSQGYYDTKTKSDGETYLDWNYRNIEGRWVTLLRMFTGNILPMVINSTGLLKNTSIGKWADNAFKEKIEWSKLTNLQKANLVEACLTIAMWSGFMLMRKAHQDDDKEDDSMTKLLRKMELNAIQPLNPGVYLDLIGNITPASFSLLNKRLTGYGILSSSLFSYYVMNDKKEALTKEGWFEGARQSMQTTPEFYMSSIYKLIQFNENLK